MSVLHIQQGTAGARVPTGSRPTASRPAPRAPGECWHGMAASCRKYNVQQRKIRKTFINMAAMYDTAHKPNQGVSSHGCSAGQAGRAKRTNVSQVTFLIKKLVRLAPPGSVNTNAYYAVLITRHCKQRHHLVVCLTAVPPEPLLSSAQPTMACSAPPPGRRSALALLLFSLSL